MIYTVGTQAFHDEVLHLEGYVNELQTAMSRCSSSAAQLADLCEYFGTTECECESIAGVAFEKSDTINVCTCILFKTGL
uniref:Uncharacterized protein n=1 Tax=Parascaris equorum TaxID=6256 RepID=A0A914S613_PAREQ